MLVAEEAVEIRVLRRQGKSIREIARTLEVSRNTVRRYLRGEGLPCYQREARASKLDPYKHYIAEAAAPDWIGDGAVAGAEGTRLHRRIQHPQGSSGDAEASSEARAADSLRDRAVPPDAVRLRNHQARARSAVSVNRDAGLEPGELRRVRNR